MGVRIARGRLGVVRALGHRRSHHLVMALSLWDRVYEAESSVHRDGKCVMELGKFTYAITFNQITIIKLLM